MYRQWLYAERMSAFRHWMLRAAGVFSAFLSLGLLAYALLLAP
jgi:hypothetical protein